MSAYRLTDADREKLARRVAEFPALSRVQLDRLAIVIGGAPR